LQRVITLKDMSVVDLLAGMKTAIWTIMETLERGKTAEGGEGTRLI